MLQIDHWLLLIPIDSGARFLTIGGRIKWSRAKQQNRFQGAAASVRTALLLTGFVRTKNEVLFESSKTSHFLNMVTEFSGTKLFKTWSWLNLGFIVVAFVINRLIISTIISAIS
jgi:hypothetical protein